MTDEGVYVNQTITSCFPVFKVYGLALADTM